MIHVNHFRLYNDSRLLIHLVVPEFTEAPFEAIGAYDSRRLKVDLVSGAHHFFGLHCH